LINDEVVAILPERDLMMPDHFILSDDVEPKILRRGLCSVRRRGRNEQNH
jgi:hypothetical protein